MKGLTGVFFSCVLFTCTGCTDCTGLCWQPNQKRQKGKMSFKKKKTCFLEKIVTTVQSCCRLQVKKIGFKSVLT